MSAPERKILKAFGWVRHRGPFKCQHAILECGHSDYTTASERRRGWVHCFDCYYGKSPFLTPEEIEYEISEPWRAR